MIKFKKLILISLILILGLFARGVSAEYASIGKGALYILGVGLSADPAQQTAPINTGTAVNTHLVLPSIDFGGSIPNTPEEFSVEAELSGPGISKPITISTKPNGQLMIPPLPQEGTYVLDNIRLISGDKIILYANPSMAVIDTIKKLIITQVVSRALSIDEIESLGIIINTTNFTAYKFTVGFGTETGIVNLEIPVVMDRRDNREDTVQMLVPKEPKPDMDMVPYLKVPNFQIVGVKMERAEIEDPMGFGAKQRDISHII